MRSSITFTGVAAQKFAVNHREGGRYTATIQNLTDETLTVTVTNQGIQASSQVFDTPASGELVIASGSVGSISEPYQGWLLTAGSPATGTVEITEAG